MAALDQGHRGIVDDGFRVWIQTVCDCLRGDSVIDEAIVRNVPRFQLNATVRAFFNNAAPSDNVRPIRQALWNLVDVIYRRMIGVCGRGAKGAEIAGTEKQKQHFERLAMAIFTFNEGYRLFNGSNYCWPIGR